MASCPDCTKGVELSGEPTGVISDIQGAYFAAGPQETSSRVIILLTDIFGLPLKNSKILADNLAKRLNCDVWVPDLFDGKPPIKPGELQIPERPGEKIAFMAILKFIFLVISRLRSFISSRPSVVDERIKLFMEKLKSEKKYEKVGAIGYCFGGSAAIRIGGTDMVNSIVIAHPGVFSMAEVKAIKVPAAWSCAESDMSFSAKYRQECEAELEGRRGKDNFVDYEFKDYKGTTHGFAARPNLAYPEVKEGFEGAFEQAVSWFEKTLPV